MGDPSDFLEKKKIMSKTTILLPREVEKKLRVIQADLMLHSSKRVGLSTVVTVLIQEALGERERRDSIPQEIRAFS